MKKLRVSEFAELAFTPDKDVSARVRSRARSALRHDLSKKLLQRMQAGPLGLRSGQGALKAYAKKLAMNVVASSRRAWMRERV